MESFNSLTNSVRMPGSKDGEHKKGLFLVLCKLGVERSSVGVGLKSVWVSPMLSVVCCLLPLWSRQPFPENQPNCYAT